MAFCDCGVVPAAVPDTVIAPDDDDPVNDCDNEDVSFSSDPRDPEDAVAEVVPDCDSAPADADPGCFVGTVVVLQNAVSFHSTGSGIGANDRRSLDGYHWMRDRGAGPSERGLQSAIPSSNARISAGDSVMQP